MPTSALLCDDWLWDGCPAKFTVWVHATVRGSDGQLLYDAVTPFTFTTSPPPWMLPR